MRPLQLLDLPSKYYMRPARMWRHLRFLVFLVAVPFFLVILSSVFFSPAISISISCFSRVPCFPFLFDVRWERGRFLALFASSMSPLCHSSPPLFLVIFSSSSPVSPHPRIPAWVWSQSHPRHPAVAFPYQRPASEPRFTLRMSTCPACLGPSRPRPSVPASKFLDRIIFLVDSGIFMR